MKQLLLIDCVREANARLTSLRVPGSWSNILWKNHENEVRRLQRRIYKLARQLQAAKRQNDFFSKKIIAKRLAGVQRLILRSKSALLIAIRRVTQLNAGKSTAGIDNIVILTDVDRRELANTFNLSCHHPQPVVRIYIPKSNGKTRPLGIPTITDRVAQTIYKLAMEPEYEAYFAATSYGFRPGRSTHDAIKLLWSDLTRRAKRGETCYALEADLTAAFDNIDHRYILKNVAPHLRNMVDAWLRAGVMESGNWSATHVGTPQGGVLSPLLANIAFHFIDVLLHEADFLTNKPLRPWEKRGAFRNHLMVRYADDLVVLGPNRDFLKSLMGKLGKALKIQIGVSLNPSKTRISFILPTLKNIKEAEACDFLGFRIKAVKPNRGIRKTLRQAPFILVTPDPKRARQFYRNLKTLIRHSLGVPYEALIQILNRRIRGWGNYYRRFNSKVWFVKMDFLLRKALMWWIWRKTQSRSLNKWRNYLVTDGHSHHLLGTPKVSLLLLADAPISYLRSYILSETPYGVKIMPFRSELGRWSNRRGVRASRVQRRSQQSWRKWLLFGPKERLCNGSA